MNSSLTASDQTFITFLNAFISNPISMTLLIVLLWITFLLYRYGSGFLDLLKNFILLKKPKRILTKKDLLNHPIFKDLDFWIEQRVDQIYSEKGLKSYDKAKLLISRDILIIKFKSAKEWLSKFISDTNFEDPYLDIRSLLRHTIEENYSYEYSKYKESQIPILFIEKFREISKIHVDYLLNTLDEILSNEIQITIYEKLYIILNFFSNYYSIKLFNTKTVIQSINGDLKGIIYKGLVIGGNDYHCYPVPSSEYIPLVKERLHELCALTKASRASVFLIHDIIGDDFSKGYFSKLYEYQSKGLASLLLEFQYKPMTYISEAIPLLKQHKGISFESTQLNEITQSLLQSKGIKKIFIYPIFLYGELKGFIGIEYLFIDNNIKEDLIFDNMKTYSSIINTYLDYTKTGFNYNKGK